MKFFDKLAKQSLVTSVAEGDYIDQELPFEQVRVSLGGRKVVGSLRKAISKHWSNRTAREFYHAKRIVSRYDFNIVYWEGMEAAMHDFPKMFRVFTTKQVSKFCGTNRQLSRIDPSIKNVCPSCGAENESSKHITRCKDPGRLAMLGLSVDDITSWMAKTRMEVPFTATVRTYHLG